MQETYLRAFEYFDKFQPGTNFRAWIFTILRNTFITIYHKQKKQAHVDLESVEPLLGSEPNTDALDARIDTSGATFRDAMSKLPEDHRIVLVLSYTEELTYREIAQVMGCPIGTVMSRLFRARQRLRDELLQKDVRRPHAVAAGAPGAHGLQPAYSIG